MAPRIVYRWQNEDGWGPFTGEIKAGIRTALNDMTPSYCEELTGIDLPEYPAYYLRRHGMTVEQAKEWRLIEMDRQTLHGGGYALHQLMVAHAYEGVHQVVFHVDAIVTAELYMGDGEV